jgi:hypothetical protein
VSGQHSSEDDTVIEVVAAVEVEVEAEMVTVSHVIPAAADVAAVEMNL